MNLLTRGRKSLLVALACGAPLLAGCQTVRGPQSVAVFAQNRGWVVEHVSAVGQTPYCIAARRAGAPELAFIATPTNTGVALTRIGTPIAVGAVLDFNVVFDNGSVRGLKSRSSDGFLLAPLGEQDIGIVLGRFSAASTATISVPALNVRKRYDLEGSAWAINKLSECARGVPARLPRQSAPVRPAPAKPSTQPDSIAAPQNLDPTPSAPSSSAPVSVPAPVAAPAAPARSGGIDLDMDLKQAVDLD
jgi:hypothetical protein